MLSRVYSNVNRQILHHHTYIIQRILDVSMIGLTLGNYIYSHEAIESLNIWAILGKRRRHVVKRRRCELT